MKKALLVLILFISFNEMHSQILIPDSNFEQALIDLGHDTNGMTGDILTADAEAVTNLNVPNRNILNLEGIAGFINLRTLTCNNNFLTNLDVSALTELQSLNSNSNFLSTLTLGTHNDLIILYSGGTSNSNLSSIDLSGCPALQYLRLSYTSIPTINLSANPNGLYKFTIVKLCSR